MSKLTRTLIIGATLTAMHLAGMTAVAQAQANDEPVRQPPTERQVGESWRHHQVAPETQTTTDPAAQRALARQRYWYYQSMLTSRQQTAQEQTAADAALQRQLARERHSIPSGTPAQVPAPVPADPNGQPGWLVASLGVLVAVLALVAAVAVMAAKQAGRRARIRHAA
jgi:predicted phage tail protein